MKRILWILVALLILLLLCGIAALFSRPGQADAERYFPDTASYLRSHDQQLQTYAIELLADRISQKPGSVSYEPPQVVSASKVVHAVTRDTNGNVYFVTDSMPWYNVGFILRKGDAELGGDQMHRHIVFTQRLFANWWYYKSKN